MSRIGFLIMFITLMGCTAVTDGDDLIPEKPTEGIVTAVAAPSPSPLPSPAPTSEASKMYETLTLSDGTELTYAIILPAGFDLQQSYPILLALPPGPQTQDMVEAGLGGYWEETAQKRGWLVISPVAPNGQLFFRGSEVYIPELLAHISQMVQPEGGQYHLAGISNGGISAFRLAVEHPDLFRSMLVVPGLPTSNEDFQKLTNLTGIPVSMFVGERDTGWLERMQETEAELSRLGGNVSLEIMPNEGHVIQSLNGGERFFDFFEAHRP